MLLGDRAETDEAIDVALRHPELPEYLSGVLAERRRRPPDGRPAASDREREAEHLNRAESGLVDVTHHVCVSNLGVLSKGRR